MLPNDQGGLSAKNYPAWRGAVIPNTNLNPGCAGYQPTVGYGGGAEPSPYLPIQSPPDSSTSLNGGEESAIGGNITSGDKLGKLVSCSLWKEASLKGTNLKGTILLPSSLYMSGIDGLCLGLLW